VTPYTLALAAAATLQLGLTVVARQHRDERLSVILGGLFVAAAIWCLAYAMQLSSGDASTAAFWNDVRLLGPTVVSPLLFLFAAAYTDREEWLGRRRLAALFAVPVVTNVLAWTPATSELVRRDLRVPAGGTLYTESVIGPWGYVYATYNYVLTVAAIALLVAAYRPRRREWLYRAQTVAVLVGVLVPSVGNVVYFLGLAPIDLTPFAFAVTGATFTVALFRYRLLELVPIARSTVFHNVEAGVLVVDTDDTVVDANDRAAAIIDVDRDRVVGATLTELFDDDLPPDVFESIVAARDLHEGIELAVDGEQRWYDVEISAIHSSVDRYVGRVIIFRDATDAVRRQRALEQRTKQLERQNERLEEFASTVSHDLKNPINVIEGHLALARETGDDDYFEVIERNTDRLAGIIDEMRATAREERTDVDHRPVELATVAAEAWSYVDNREATLATPTERSVTGDRDRLLRLFENLFRNALDHGSDDVTVTVGDFSDGFFVADDGPGIPAEQRGVAFERGHTTADGGTGLGLAIVATTAQAYGWSVRIAESADDGARFEFVTE
jgi:PAS domain S-box-containing protein